MASIQQTLMGFQGQEEIEGVVDSVIYASNDGKFSVFRVKPSQQNSRITATIKGEPPLVGQQVHLKGQWVNHARFGQQFRAASIHIEAPSSVEGIERFLASGVIDGVGKAMAHRLVTAFGQDTLKIIEERPKRLLEVPGIGKQTADKIAASYSSQSELGEIMLWLENHGISGTLAGRIYKKYSSFSLDMLENHPYQLAQEVEGIGFATADTIAASLGLPRDHEQRVMAGIDYALQQISLAGHCCIPEDPLVDRASRLLSVDRGRVREVLQRELQAQRLLVEEARGETLIYPPYLYRAEIKTARKLLYLQRYADPIELAESPAALVTRWERAAGIRLSQGQRQAMAAVLQHGVFVLTGGPGTGKTTVIRGMLDLLEHQGLEILLGAPTGRAAKRLAEATGRRTMTVHRMLEAQGGQNSNGAPVFGKTEDEQLEADVIILDEVSMMDIVLMQHFLAAVPDGCHVILVGDVDQLPAVGPGAVLKDIIRSEAIPCVCLTEIFRQHEESTIVVNAHAINAGRLPVCSPHGDFQFWEMPDETATAAKILEFCTRILPAQGFSPLFDVQVLSPMHRQACGVDNLNVLLQAALNPAAPSKPEFVSRSQTFRLGDKVMQMKNNYTKQVFNGDIGFIVNMEPGRLTVRFGEDLEAEYEQGEMGELQLAYAMSVHKSQGSEYPVIVLPLIEGHYIMLQRNLLYTAVTRAKRLVILLGSRAALNTAVENDRTKRRYTLLAERLHQGK
ncbi:ATP-dependent RecD-like DNA helicase [Mitsuokella sp.]|uniref:SF1B family DNA helicase RecD2 n=1 Tax=Mitsuokella sp. TaxID=2049034 RepID=UPI0029E1C861|nr:ATP-dependent RecD-like DNA helicase [Mitsuokella sp.]MDD6382143.1 ATP-dependent RecD-like DNA helicase [Selenomonadaceae bacterium]MDY4475747.1 ATP-dependent RecD-like DNA helicase [Mitsuokella sp.]